jgi:hypothetical protein
MTRSVSGRGTDADVVRLDGAIEGFAHAIALRAFDRRDPRLQPDLLSEAAGFPGGITAPIIRQMFNHDRQAIDQARSSARRRPI